MLSLLRLTPETATLYAAALAVIGSIFGGWIGARATVRAMRESIQASDRARGEVEKGERLSALKALDRELRMNLAIAAQPRVDRAWVLFQHAALDAAQPYLLTLPDEVYRAIQEARLALSRYNTLALFLNHEGEPPLVAERIGDWGAANTNSRSLMRRGDSFREVGNLAQEAVCPLQAAIGSLEDTLSPINLSAGTRGTTSSWWHWPQWPWKGGK